MRKYYYLAAQLPFLQFDKKPAITKDFFLREAEKWLSEQDFLILSKVDINDFIAGKECFPPALREYKDFEFRLRQEVSLRRKKDFLLLDLEISPPVKEALAGDNPLDVERKLLFLRWKFIEEKELGHYFDLEYLSLYFLKIQILERLFMFDKDKGVQVFDKVCGVSL